MQKLLPTDLMQIKEGAWPQYYIGAYPYCFQLPAYTETSWPPKTPAGPASHAGHGAKTSDPAPERPLLMGQSPGTHWYHAHKHGSTTINVSNGMTGVFVIEGKYDDDLNAYYGAGWTRKQPILAINELGVSPNLFTGTRGPLPFQVNGRPQPTVSMQSGEVQMWRIVNSASRSGAYFVGPPQGFEWKQIAQDGVQYTPANYQNNQNNPFLMAAGNRVDLLVKAPVNTGMTPQSFAVQVRQAVNDSEAATGTPTTLFTVTIPPGPAATGNNATFVPQAQAPTQPAFLADIGPEEVSGTKKVVFESAAPNPKPVGAKAPFTQHYIDGKKFDGNIGEVVLLNKVEEWTIENRTTPNSQPGAINHPFHIHINPFQIVEVFNPLEQMPDPNNPANRIDRYVIAGGTPPVNGQCVLDPGDPSTWKPCVKSETSGRIWWDVFPIPSGRQVTGLQATAGGTPPTIVIPGYFKMRSRFVDYTGQYVIHCHILAHEDRGMMTVVSVVPFKTPYSHH